MSNVIRFLAALCLIALAVAVPMAVVAVNTETALAETARLDLTPEGGTITAGVPFNITVTAYDSSDNVDTSYTGTVLFSSSDTAIDMTPSYTFESGDAGTRTFSVTLRTSGNQSITVTDQDNSSLTDTEVWMVNPGDPAYLDISPPTASIVAGSIQAYSASSFDEYGNEIGDVTGSTVFSIQEPGDAGTWSANSYTSKKPGTWTVQGSYLSLTGTATLTVNAGPAAYVVISPEAVAITAGSSQAYTAEAFDQEDNSLGSVTGSTIFVIVESGHGGTWLANTYTSGNIGTWTVRGAYSGLIDTTPLTVNPGTPHHIVISPDAATIAAGATQAYTARLFDQSNNDLGDITAATVFSVPPAAGGSWAAAVYTSQFVGTWTVTGTYQTFTDEGTLSVIASPAHHIVISPDSAVITAGGIQSYTAQAFDQFNNSLGDVTPQTGFIIQTGAGGSWTSNVYSSQYVGTWTVTGGYLGLTDTATLTVTAGPAGQIAISPVTGTTSAGAAFNITVTARDTYGNPAITYAGTVAFTSSDGAATLPADYAFQTADAGVHVFSISLATAGSQTITATDKANGALTDTRTWFVESTPLPTNRPPAQPANVAPAGGATGLPVTPALQSSAFSDPDSGNTHAASQWQITTTPGNYSSPIFDSGTRTAQLTTMAIPSGVLSYSSTYYWHVRHQDNRGAWSGWSAETSFGTAAQPSADFSVGSVSGSGGSISIL
ncbi:MAG: hypothetical protein FJ020_09065, partial [Chloroflexi bacterium]|nr:hypothetical protein [Chloroflexota bacterium]